MLGETQRLLEQFQSLYESKLAAVEKNKMKHSMTEEEVLRMQVTILRAYVTDLAEQNLGLIQTAALLQTEAEDRVTTLEKLLDKTTVTSKDFMQKINDYQEEISQEKLNAENEKAGKVTLYGIIQSKFKNLEAERNVLREYNAYLVHEISSLIQAVYRGQKTGCWDFRPIDSSYDDFDGFLSIEKNSASVNLSIADEFSLSKEQGIYIPDKYDSRLSNDAGLLYRRSTTSSIISSPDGTSSRFSAGVTDKDVLIKRLQVDLKFLEKGNGEKSLRLLAKDKAIASLQSQVTELRHELAVKESECEAHMHSLRNKMDEQRHVNSERSRSDELIRQLKMQVEKLENQINGSTSSRVDNHVFRQVAATQTDGVLSVRRKVLDDTQEEEKQWHELVINGLRVTLSEKEAEIKRLENEIEKLELGKNEEVKSEEESLKEICESMRVKLEDALKMHEDDKLKIKKLEEDWHYLERSSQENRLILTNEIAERHDVIKNLRQELADQTEHQKEIVQQLVLKSEVIKSLRKNVKQHETEAEEIESKMVEVEKRLQVERQLVEGQAVEIENQKITIANLQEALVQVKRNNYSHSTAGIASPSIDGGNVINGGMANVKTQSRLPTSEIFDI